MSESSQAKEKLRSPKASEYYSGVIEKLRQETTELKTQIQHDQLNIKALSTESYITQLQDQRDAYSRKLEQAKKRKEELNCEIKELQNSIEHKKQAKHMKSDRSSTEHLNLKIKQTENKIDKLLLKYNEIVTKNKQLKENVDTLRKEKLVSISIKKGLQEELEKKQKELTEKLDENKKIKKNRDLARQKLRNFKEETDREREHFKKSQMDLNRIIENKQSIKHFFSPDSEDPADPGAFSPEILENLQKAIEDVRTEKNHLKTCVKTKKQDQEAYDAIKEEAQIADNEQLVEAFKRAEHTNYSLYNNVNELTAEIERLEKQIRELQSENKKNKGQGMTSEKLRDRIFNELDTRLKGTEDRVTEYEKRYGRTMGIIDGLKAGIQEILETIGTNDPVIEEILNNQDVTEANMIQCLGIIELRTNEILQMHEWVKQGKAREPLVRTPADSKDKPKICIPFEQVVCRDHRDRDGEDEESGTVQPLTLEEMREKAIIESAGQKRHAGTNF